MPRRSIATSACRVDAWVSALSIGCSLAALACEATEDGDAGDPPSTATLTNGTGDADGNTVTTVTNGAMATSTSGATGGTTMSSSGEIGTSSQTTGAAAAATGVNTAAGVGGAGGSGGTARASSAGGGTSGDGDSTSGAPTAGGAGNEDPPGVAGIIAVGYGGLRIVSRDLGETWENESHWSENGGDDHDLLRTIAYGNGVWVTAGWRLNTSEDGVNWVDHGDAEDVITAVNCPVTDGMAFGAGNFLVACGSNLARSEDGLSWERVGPTPGVGGHPYLVYDEDSRQFACSGDNGTSYLSDDGEGWTEVAVDNVRLCDGLVPEAECPSFYADGVYLSAEWGGYIRRSTTGSNFSTTYTDEFGNNLFTEYSFARGRVAP